VIDRLNVYETGELKRCENIIRQGLREFVTVGNALMKIRDQRLYRAKYTSFEDYLREEWKLSRSRGYQLIGAAEVVGNLEGPVRHVEVVKDESPPPPVQYVTVVVGDESPRDDPIVTTARVIGDESPRDDPIVTTARVIGDESPREASEDLSTVVDISGLRPICESQTRALSRLPTAELQRAAWAQAVSEANGRQPTAAQVSLAVGAMEDRIRREARVAQSNPQPKMPKVRQRTPDDDVESLSMTLSVAVLQWKRSSLPLATLITLLRRAADELEEYGELRRPDRIDTGPEADLDDDDPDDDDADDAESWKGA
jgi:hypothetical protein